MGIANLANILTFYVRRFVWLDRRVLTFFAVLWGMLLNPMVSSDNHY